MTLTGERDGQAAGFWLKTIDLTPDLSRFRLYYTAVSRVAASWIDCGERPECTAPGGFEEALNIAVGAPVAVDAAPLAAGLIDEATFVAQGITGSWQTVDALRFIVEDLGVQPDLLLLGTSFPEAVSRQFLGFLAERDAVRCGGNPVAGRRGRRRSHRRRRRGAGGVRARRLRDGGPDPGGWPRSARSRGDHVRRLAMGALAVLARGECRKGLG